MSTVHELMVQGAAVLATVSEVDGLYHAQVNGMPQIEAWGETREAALSKVARRAQYAADIAA